MTSVPAPHLGSFPHGIHPREEKDFTATQPIRRMPFAPFLVIFLSQHAGRPAIPVVQAGEWVERGALLGKADGFFSVPVHAPASGKIRAISRALDFNGKMAPAVILQPDPASPQAEIISTFTACAPDSDPIDQLSSQQIIEGIQAMGMVGLGGAAFPTHVKLLPPKGKTVDTLIINGCECEPYLTSDHRVMVEMPAAVMLGSRLIAKALGVRRLIIGVEDNKPDALAQLRAEADRTGAAGPTSGVVVEIAAVRTKYPQGAEKMLTKALLNREIPSGGLPADIGVVVSNVATAAEVGTLLPHGRGLIERVVTVSGRGVSQPGNYLIPIGTPLDFVLREAGFSGSAKQVVFGGPMMGKAVAFLETPTTKGLTGIVVMAEDEVPQERPIYPCIRCSQCVQACPIFLNPSQLGLLARKDLFDRMAEEQHLFDCFECGCCTYVCPSNIPLVQYFRLAKSVLRKRQAKP